MIRIDRPQLWALMDTPRHVMLCAPLGYGKSTLMHQYARQHPDARLVTARKNNPDLTTLLGEVVPGASTLAELEDAGVRTLMIDHAHESPPELIETLLRQARELSNLRLILSARHSSYPGIQAMLRKSQLRILSDAQLAFTREEAAQFERGLDTYDAHLGWPVVVSAQVSAHFNLDGFLNETVMDLPMRLQDQLREGVRNNNLTGLLLDWNIAQQMPEVSNLGFPLIEQQGALVIHPLLTGHLASFETPLTATNGVSEALKAHLQLTRNTKDPATRRLIVDTYFTAHGENEPSIQARIELLETVPVSVMTPAQRDRLANLLITVARMSDAQHLLDLQRNAHTETCYTYFGLARIANYRNELPAMQAFLAQARTVAKNDEILSKILGMESLLQTRLQGGDPALALALAEERHTVATRAGLLCEELASYWSIANAYQYLGDLEGAVNAAQAGLKRAENFPNQDNIMLDLLVMSSDTLKSLGRYDEALSNIQAALTINEDHAYSGLPYAHFTRGLVYLELGWNNEAIASFQVATERFQVRENLAGVLMPLCFQAYTQWRLGWTESLRETRTALTHITKKMRLKPEYVEWQAYVPLIEGLYHLSRHEPVRALEELRKTHIDGHEMYDSVLLSVLLALQIQLTSGVFNPQDARQLIALLDFTHTTDDVTLVAYADDFAAVVQAMIDHGPQPERFRKIQARPRPKAGAKPQYRVTLQTMTPQPSISVNGTKLPTANLWPVYTLAYLTYKFARVTTDYVSSDLLAQELYGDQKNSAQSSVSHLRGALAQRDQELEQDLLSPRGDRRGYRLVPQPHITVEMDVFEYLSPTFSDANPDRDLLWQMLRDIQPFLQTRKDTSRQVSPFILEINKDLRKQAKAVTRHLETLALQGGHTEQAVLALALYLRFNLDDYDLIHEILALIPAGHPLRPHVTALNHSGQGGLLLSEQIGALISAIAARPFTPAALLGRASD